MAGLDNAEIRIIGRDETGAAIASAKRGFASLADTVSGLRGMMLALGAPLTVAAIGSIVKSAIDLQDNLGKMSQKVGVGVEALSGLKYAAELSDVSVEELGTGLAKLGRNMAETQANTGESKIAFDALKISVEASKGTLKTTEAVLLEVAEKFAGMEDGAGKTALAMKLFGRSGQELIPFLNQGRDGIGQLTEEARKFGLIIGAEAAKASEQFNDNLKRLSAAAEGLKLSLANELLPTLNDFMQAMVDGKMAGVGLIETMVRLGNIKASGAPLGTQLATINAELDENARKQEILKGQLFGRVPGVPGANFALGMRESDLLRQREEILREMRRREKEVGAGGWEQGMVTSPAKTRAPALPDMDALKRRQSEIDALLKKGQLSEEQAIIARFDAANDAYIAQGQRDKKALDEWLKDEAEAQKKSDAGWVAHADAVFEAAMASDLALAKLQEDDAKRTDKMADAARELGLTFSSAFEDAIVGGKAFSEVLAGLEKDILRIMARKLVTEPLADAASGFMKDFDFGKIIGGLFGGFASGGSFRVGGSGGTDSQLVAFNATPGETVDVRTPGQAAVRNGGAINMVNNFTISGPMDRRSQEQIGAAVFMAGSRASRRNN